MTLPKFLLADNTDCPDAIFVLHTEYPRFVVNLADDTVEWFEEFSKEDQNQLEAEAENLLGQANEFYDREVSRYQD